METDFLVIGSGIAALNAAIRATRFGRVMVATKDKLQESNTFHAQGGLAGAFGKDDSIDSHVEDTLRAGDGITNKKIAKILATEAPKRINDLKKWGVKFHLNKNGYVLSREAVHSRARIVHVQDITGKKIEELLIKKVISNQRIAIHEHFMAINLILEKEMCIGCQFLDIRAKKIVSVYAKKIILATGGIGRIYSVTTNPEVATGDGIAIGFRAGADLEDMEFVQFHPTMLHNSNPPFLISETLRGEGGLLKNKKGKTYMKKYHRDGELAPRDVVSRFSEIEMKRTGSKNVFLDVTHMDSDYVKRRFPHIYSECLKYKIDITKKMIPVSPASHYLCGGIKTDEYARTNIKNLYAVGECACTQLHGADRLASNSMTEGLVFGTRLINKIGPGIKKEKIHSAKTQEPLVQTVSNGKVTKLKKLLQDIMWKNAGVIRNKKGLQTAKEKIKKIEKKLKPLKEIGINREIQELHNMILISKIIIYSALRRKESRGTHFILEYPERYDNIWQKHLTVNKSYKKIK